MRKLIKTAVLSVILIFTLSIGANAIVLPDNNNFYLLDLSGEEGTVWHHRNRNVSLDKVVSSYQNYFPLNEYSIFVYSGLDILKTHAKTFLESNGYDDVRLTTVDDLVKNNPKLTMYVGDNSKLSPLYSEVKKVTENVYTFIGDPSPPSSENYGHNNNISFVVGSESVLVFNAGGSAILASTVHAEIKNITNLPIKYLVFENSQAHAVLGSKYWNSVPGVNIVSNIETYKRLKTTTPMLLRAKKRLKSNFYGSGVSLPGVTFENELVIDLGGVKVELKHLGPAHGADDTLLYIEKDSIVITGDYAFNQRMLPIHSDTDIPSWLNLWSEIESLNAKVVIPGHGDVTTMSTVKKSTYDYLYYLRSSIESILEEDGELNDALSIDTSKFNYLRLYRLLNSLNIERVFTVMEFE